jgi:flagellar FliL protein
MSEETEDEGVPKKKVSGKRLILVIGILVIIIGGAAAAVIGLGLLDSIMGGEQAEEEVVPEEETVQEIDPVGVFYPLEEITVSLTSTGARKPILVIELAIEVEDEAAVARIEQLRPRLISEFNGFLQELRAEELNGSEGAYLLREELFRRASQVLAPTPVKNVLLTSFLVRS